MSTAGGFENAVMLSGGRRPRSLSCKLAHCTLRIGAAPRFLPPQLTILYRGVIPTANHCL